MPITNRGQPVYDDGYAASRSGWSGTVSERQGRIHGLALLDAADPRLNGANERPIGWTTCGAEPWIQFGKRVTALSKKRGWSQEELALKSGMARSNLGGVERGQRNNLLISICRLADALYYPQ